MRCPSVRASNGYGAGRMVAIASRQHSQGRKVLASLLPVFRRCASVFQLSSKCENRLFRVRFGAPARRPQFPSSRHGPLAPHLLRLPQPPAHRPQVPSPPLGPQPLSPGGTPGAPGYSPATAPTAASGAVESCFLPPSDASQPPPSFSATSGAPWPPSQVASSWTAPALPLPLPLHPL